MATEYTNEAEKSELGGRNASVVSHHVPIEDSGKSRWERLWPVIACGAGLFSDGYLNNVCIFFYMSKYVY